MSASGPPWTLSNEKVWDKTHRLGGRLFKITGVLVAAFGFFFDQNFEQVRVAS